MLQLYKGEGEVNSESGEHSESLHPAVQCDPSCMCVRSCLASPVQWYIRFACLMSKGLSRVLCPICAPLSLGTMVGRPFMLNACISENHIHSTNQVVTASVCVCVCMRACVRACVCACVCDVHNKVYTHNSDHSTQCDTQMKGAVHTYIYSAGDSSSPFFHNA